MEKIKEILEKFQFSLIDLGEISSFLIFFVFSLLCPLLLGIVGFFFHLFFSLCLVFDLGVKVLHFSEYGK
jgi:hypothetical protein